MGWTTLEQRIARTELLINTILNDAELKAAALSTNINDATIAEGSKHVRAVHAAEALQARLDGEWQALRKQRKALRDAVVERYGDHRRVARLLIEDPTIRSVLDLNGPRVQTVVEQHAQMVKFYANGLSDADALSALGHITITRAMLEAEHATLAQITYLVQDEHLAKRKKEEATAARDAALDTLDLWYAQTLQGMTYATKGKPHLLKRLSA